MASNYDRGRALEYRCRDKLTAAGWTVVRAAGSKGPADLVALRAGSFPVFVQVKIPRNGMGPAERLKFYRAAQTAGAAAVHVHRDGRQLVWRYMTEPNESVEWEPTDAF